jgi:hypothetical protein
MTISAYSCMFVYSCSLEEFVKLFANHRPVLGTDKKSLEDAFQVLATHAAAEAAKAAEAAAAEAAKKRGRRTAPSSPGGPLTAGGTAGGSSTVGAGGSMAGLFGPGGMPSGALRATATIDWQALKQQLVSGGEALSEDELSKCLEALVGLGDLPSGPVSAEAFVSQVLGFEEDDNGGDCELGEEQKGKN